MTASDVRSTLGLVLPYGLLGACLIAARCGVPETLVSLVAGGALAAIDPRRGQPGATTTVTAGDPPIFTTEPAK